MNNRDLTQKIIYSFEKIVKNDKKVKNAYLLINSNKLQIDINIAKGFNQQGNISNSQPVHLASVGKLFTATIISILHEKKLLSFNNKVSNFLDNELMHNLHFFKGKNYSEDITIRHLLMQTSGLYDVFYSLLKIMLKNPDFDISPREAVLWGKKNLKPVSAPGLKHHYTDTNYYLLGLIIESILKKPFHEVIHEMIFDKLCMNHSSIHGFSEPKIKSDFPTAKLFIKNNDLLSIKGIHQIDYSGGSVIAPLSEYLLFMKALVENNLITNKTLNTMISDDIFMGFPTIGFKYGYSIWKPLTIPVILPKQFQCWGCVGATGAFMFYHPLTESYIIGSFNDFSYRGKALEFMFKKVIKELINYQQKN